MEAKRGPVRQALGQGRMHKSLHPSPPLLSIFHLSQQQYG